MRARVAAIMRSDAAKGCEKQALAIALDTDMDPIQANAVLATSPVEGASRYASARDPFAEIQRRSQNGGGKVAGAGWDGVHAEIVREFGFSTRRH